MAEKNRKVYEKHIEVRGEQGEVLQSTNETVSVVAKEPDFIKLYLDHLTSFRRIKGLSVDVLAYMCRYVTYSNLSAGDPNVEPMRITFNRLVKKEIAEACNISEAMLNKYIKKCVDGGLFCKTEYRGIYTVSPFLLAKGEWKAIKELRAQFDYVTGKLTLQKNDSIIEEPEEPPKTETKQTKKRGKKTA